VSGPTPLRTGSVLERNADALHVRVGACAPCDTHVVLQRPLVFLMVPSREIWKAYVRGGAVRHKGKLVTGEGYKKRKRERERERERYKYR